MQGFGLHRAEVDWQDENDNSTIENNSFFRPNAMRRPSMPAPLHLIGRKSSATPKIAPPISPEAQKLAELIRQKDEIIEKNESFSLVAAAIAERVDLEQDYLIETQRVGRYIGAKVKNAGNGVRRAGPRPIDCMSYVMLVLQKAFETNGKADAWKAIQGTMNQFVRDRANRIGLHGIDLIAALQRHCGWISTFASFDSEYTPTRRALEQVADEGGTYYSDKKHKQPGAAIDRSKLVSNFDPRDEERKNDSIECLKRLPFAIGGVGSAGADGSGHMFIVIYGKVYECHWTHGAADKNLIEGGQPFEQWAARSNYILAAPSEDIARAWAAKMPTAVE